MIMRTKPTFKTKFSFTFNEVEYDTTVEFRYSPGHPGCWYRRNGDPGDPPEPAEVDIIKVTDASGTDITDIVGDFLDNSETFYEAAGETYEAAQLPEEV